MKKIFRRLIQNDSGGVATYVLIMFGMVFILYLFGFTNLWIAYQTNAEINGTDITESSNSFGYNILSGIVRWLSDPDNYMIMGAGIFGAIALIAIGKITGSLSTILQYLIPLILLLALNIFVFPLQDLSNEITFMNATGTTITIFLFAFFNLFYVLAVIEFMRGNI